MKDAPNISIKSVAFRDDNTHEIPTDDNVRLSVYPPLPTCALHTVNVIPILDRILSIS